MPYPEEFYDRAMDGLTGQKRLLECLLWRGFLAVLKDDQVRLLRGSPQDDLQLLEACGLVIRSAPDAFDEYAAVIGATDNDVVLRKVFRSQTNNGMAGPPFVNETYSSFKNCKFGSKVPVNHLDPGVALLVKALPAAGVCTVMSCDGHYQAPPRICMRTTWDLRWSQHVLSNIAQTLGIAANDQPWSFTDKGNDWCNYYLEWNTTPTTDWFELFSQIQQFARNLLNADTALAFRHEKQGIGTLNDFDQRFPQQPFAPSTNSHLLRNPTIMTIRPHSIDDHGFIFQQAKQFERFGPYVTIFQSILRRDPVALINVQNVEFFIAEVDEKAAAFIAVEWVESNGQFPGKGIIHGVAADPQFQRRGAATRLLDHVKNRAHDKGFSQLEATTAETANPAAMGLFAGYGFQNQGRNGIYPMRQNALSMRLNF